MQTPSLCVHLSMGVLACSCVLTSAQASMSMEKSKPINKQVLALAVKAYNKAYSRGLVKKPYLTIIDFTADSASKRMWVIDLKRHRVHFNTHVAHGQKSGFQKPVQFSNQIGSHQSSLGVFLTGQTYRGSVGYALRLKGLEKGFNDQAMQRAVVMHGAHYVDQGFIRANGRAGRSFGCPAIPVALTRPVLNTIKEGSLIVAYYPDKNWLKKSQFLK